MSPVVSLRVASQNFLCELLIEYLMNSVCAYESIGINVSSRRSTTG